MPTPSAASLSIIAPVRPPVAAPTITESAVAMKNALPRPQTARSPTSCSIEPAAEHSAVAATISVSPTSTVRFGPNLALAAPVTSIAMTWTPRYDEKSSVTCDGVASRPLAMDSRIGSTRPIPMKAMTAANAVIHTCLGWPLTASSRLEWCSALIADQFLLLGVELCLLGPSPRPQPGDKPPWTPLKQFCESRQGGFDRCAVGVVHRDEPLAEELLSGGDRLGVEATTLVGDVHEHRSPVGGVRRAGGQAEAFEAADDVGHRRQLDPLELRQRAHPPRPAVDELAQHRALRQGQRQLRGLAAHLVVQPEDLWL